MLSAKQGSLQIWTTYIGVPKINAMSDNQEETAYYLRLVSMYMDLCTESVRKVFNLYSPNNNGEDFIRLNQAKLNELKTKGILNQQECEVVITQWPNLRLMDTSLLITLSINLFTTVQLPPPTKGWDRPPKGKDISIAADLLRLRKIRNVIVGHHPCARLPQWVFENEWKNIETILLRIERQIDPGNEVHLQHQIESYFLQQLQPCIQNEHDLKLKEWYQEVSKAQKQVDEYLKNLEGFNVYLKDKSDRYERYIKLLVKGGQFVLSALIKTKCQQSDLRCKLDEKEDILREKITDSEHLEILYPSASDRLATPLDLSVWDISLLTGVLLYAFECSGDLKEAIDNLYNARKNYAEIAVKSLDPDTFVDYLSDLKYSINVAKNYLNSEEKSHINEILEESKKKAKEDGSFKTYMEELKSQGLQMKTFSDIHKETVQKTKEKLQQMITHGISFDSNRMLDLKMITVGSDEEKKKIAENILFEVWQIALDRTENKGNFQEIQEEVNKILKKIKKSKNIQNISVEQKCVLLQIASREPCDMLALIEYFESDLFHKTLDDICKEVGYHCDTIVAICSNVTIESLHGILNEQHLPKQQESGIRVPITVSSPATMMELWKLFRSEQFSNSTNAIAEELSKHSNTTVTLKTFTDMKELNDVFDGETEQSSTDSESNDSWTQDSSRTLDTELDFPYKGDVAGHPADQSSKYDKQKEMSGQGPTSAHKMRRNVSPPQRQGPMKAAKPFILKRSPPRSPSPPTIIILHRRSPVTDSRHSPDGRFPGPSSPGSKETEQSSTDSESNDSWTQESSRTLDTELDFQYKGRLARLLAAQSSKYDKQKEMSGQGPTSAHKMLRNVSPPQRQGSMKAMKPFILKSSPSRSPSSPTLITLQRRFPVTDSRHSPDRRSPGPTSQGFKVVRPKAIRVTPASSSLRRTSSLNTIGPYWKGQWPVDIGGCHHHTQSSGTFMEDKGTQTPEDWHVEVADRKAEKKKKKHKRSASFGHADKRFALNSIRQKLQKTKDQGTKQRSSPIPGNHNAFLQTAPAVLMRSPAIGTIHIPKTSIPRWQRNSVEGLNPEVQMMMQLTISGTEEEIERSIDNIPDGHRAPVPEIRHSGTRSINTLTPFCTLDDRSSGSPASPASRPHSIRQAIPIMPGNLENSPRPSSNYDSSGSTPRDKSDKDTGDSDSPYVCLKKTASPKPNKIVREPPDGCEIGFR